MEKQCFVMMPVSDQEGYALGHFKRVYEYIIVPACRAAGFWPARADESIVDPWDLTRNIIDSDLTICDLSARTQNVLYGLAIRQALSVPVTILKDIKTQSADILEFGAVEYDESLRIDTVQNAIQALSEALKSSFDNKGEYSTILNRLRIGPGQLALANQGQSTDSTALAHTPEGQEENISMHESALPIISPLPDDVGDVITQGDIDKMKVGDFLFHINYGKGELKSVKVMGKDKLASVHFEAGSKTLVLATAGYFRRINKIS